MVETRDQSRRRHNGNGFATPSSSLTRRHKRRTAGPSPTSRPTLASTPLRRYFSRREGSRLPEVPTTDDFVGIYSKWAVLWGILFLIVPISYIYIGLVLLRELCMSYPDSLFRFISHYAPIVATLVEQMDQKSSRLVEKWCWIEALFYICIKLKIKWLQCKDPLEASLSAAPLMDIPDRRIMWQRMMDCEKDDPITFLTGWFFDEPIENISKYDVRDFCAWSMFEGRHQEHLTTRELRQLEDFVEEAEYRISLHLYGAATEDDNENEANGHAEEEQTNGHANNKDQASLSEPAWKADLPKPRKMFHFAAESKEEPSFFSDLYESFRTRYEKMSADFHPVQDLKDMVNDIHPVQDLKNLLNETAQHIHEAEENAKARASQVYTSIVPEEMDKKLTAMSHATYTQLTDAWDSVKNMKERLETARFLSQQRQRIRQQLKGYRVMLHRMVEMSSAVPSAQMAAMMRRITEANKSLELLENRAQNAFVKATGFARNSLPNFLDPSPPRQYAKYSYDPLYSIKSYPLGFHLLLLGGTEIPLRIMMMRRGFERRSVGPVSYYFHPGRMPTSDCSAHGSHDDSAYSDEQCEYDSSDDMGYATSSVHRDETELPIVFVHGIGIGLISYIPLIDRMLETGRPIMLPEIPYVSGFRPWLSPDAVLPPASVVSTMTAMLASHGFIRATWVGHSYGTSWLSYMIKYATHAVAAVCFLDPICFCLHAPRLTKSFVYSRPDPGTVSYILRTDMIVNWTIQRSFPWMWIILFLEQIGVPCSVFTSEKDALVPAVKVEEYLRKRDVPVRDFESATREHFLNREQTPPASTYDSDDESYDKPLVNLTVFRGDGHGDWVDRPAETVPCIAMAIEVLCERAEGTDNY